MTNRSYSELKQFKTFDERFRYLSLKGEVGRSTFGFDRWLNQRFYSSSEWQNARELVILRDAGCDLGIEGFEIFSDLLIHHMNPITSDDIINGEESLLDPEFLITTSKKTHNAIHYGNGNSPYRPFVSRQPNDTKLW